jgi:hypothetical protein
VYSFYTNLHQITVVDRKLLGINTRYKQKIGLTGEIRRYRRGAKGYKSEKNAQEIFFISQEMKPISQETVSVSWEIRENHTRDEICLSRDRFKLPRDEVYLL